MSYNKRANIVTIMHNMRDSELTIATLKIKINIGRDFIPLPSTEQLHSE